MIKKRAFTLAELLITLLVIGIVAVLTLPSLITNVANKTMATQIKSIVGSIQQLASDQMLIHKTKNLALTDFGSPGELLTPNNFAMTKSCTGSKSTENACWGSSYQNLNSGSVILTHLDNSILLKNGASLSYSTVNYRFSEISDMAIGYFVVDVNGPDDPNIVGRDVFGFYVTENGHVEAKYPTEIEYDEVDDGIRNLSCEAGSEVRCLRKLIENNWTMNY